MHLKIYLCACSEMKRTNQISFRIILLKFNVLWLLIVVNIKEENYKKSFRKKSPRQTRFKRQSENVVQCIGSDCNEFVQFLFAVFRPDRFKLFALLLHHVRRQQLRQHSVDAFVECLVQQLTTMIRQIRILQANSIFKG